MHEQQHHEPAGDPQHAQVLVQANPGSAGWAAGAAFAGRVIGGVPGLIYAAATAKEPVEGETPTPSYAGAAIRLLGQVGGAAGGAALGAPPEMKGRAAIGAALGAWVPFIGAPLSALGAYIATRPKDDRQHNTVANPMSTGGVVALSLLGLAVVGGGTYYGVKALKKRKEEKENGNGELEPGNVDDWGANMDENEHWGVGPVTGQDGNEYAYIIYHNLKDDSYWYAFRGEAQNGSSCCFETGDEAAWCVDNRLPGDCYGSPGES